MQAGTILRHRRSWVLRWYEPEFKDGKKVRTKKFRKLAPIGPDYPDKRSVESLAWKILEPVNTKALQPESAVPVAQFIEEVYLPFVKQNLRASTYIDYRNAFRAHIKSRLGEIRLKDFRTVHGQRLIASIAKENPKTGHKTLLRLKSLMSGALKHAKREGLLDHENPMRDVSVPGRAKKFIGRVYTVEELYLMGERLSGAAFVVVMTAAFTGLRLAELRGLQWQDFDGQTLQIRRTMWRTQVGETKTAESEASVPVLPLLRKILTDYRTKVNGQPQDWMFQGARKQSMNLPNLARRVIIPALEVCLCGKLKSEHDGADHTYERDPKIPDFRGWHSFRRSLASNLYSMGVAPKVIQGILRHRDIGVTLEYYVQTNDEESREAMRKMEDWFTDAGPSETRITDSEGNEVSWDELERLRNSQQN